MRTGLFIAVFGLFLAGSGCAQAQTQTTQGAPYYTNTPVYVTPPGTPYAGQNNGAAPLYNNGTNAQPYSMEQMIAGKNAPSYNYNSNGVQPYTFGNQPSGYQQTVSPDQIGALVAQREAQALQYQSQLAQQGQGYQGSTFSQLYTNPFAQEPPPPKKKRVLRKLKDDPLAPPPRLFDPDQ